MPQLADEPRFATSPLRVANRKQMVEEFTRVFFTRPSGEWLPILKGADILCAPVASYEDVARHPQVAANRMIAQLRHPSLGTLRMPGFPINSTQENTRVSTPAPACGEHTRAVLLAMGYADDEVAALSATGAIHCGDARLEPEIS